MKSFLLAVLLVFGFVGTAEADRIVIKEPRGRNSVVRPQPAPHHRHGFSYYGFSFSFGTPVVPYYVTPVPRLIRVYDAITGYYYYYDSMVGVYYGPYLR